MLVIRLMGKRQIGQLQPFEFIIAIMIADVASTPMDGAGIPITYGIVPIITLLILHKIIAFISMKSDGLRAFFSGKPSIIIHKGIIRQKALSSLNYNLNDLIEQLRAKDVANISDVYYAVLETNGELNVMLKPEKRTVTPSDMSLAPENPGFCYDIILDGKLKDKNLQELGYTKKAVERLLSSKKIKGIKKVFIATSDEKGSVFIQDYHGNQMFGSMSNG